MCVCVCVCVCVRLSEPPAHICFSVCTYSAMLCVGTLLVWPLRTLVQKGRVAADNDG